MKKYKFTVDKQKVTCESITPIISDSVNYIVAHFDFVGDWEDLTKKQ